VFGGVDFQLSGENKGHNKFKLGTGNQSDFVFPLRKPYLPEGQR
jgi:hypothetical protein